MKKLFYGFGGLSYSVISQTISNFFMFFATSVLGISGTLVGITIGISTIWDGISDTLIGFISDNKKPGKFGKRNGFMLIATLGMSLFNVVLWVVPNSLNSGLKFVWILISLLLLETFNTMFATPYNALGNELSNSYHDRTKTNAFSTVFYLIGIIVPSVLMIIFLKDTQEYPIGQLNPNGYIKISLVTSSICLIFGLLCALLTIPKSTEANENQSYAKISLKALFSGFMASFKNKKLNTIIWGYVFTSIATVFLCSVGLHFFTYSFFYTTNQITCLLITLMLGTISSQPLWVFISKKKNKKPSLLFAIFMTVLSVFGIIAVYLFRVDLYKISFYLMIGLIFICGIGSGALYSLPMSMYGDAIVSLTNDDVNLMATYSGTMTFASNIANSITQLLVGILLDVIKFDSSLQVQTLGVQTGLALILFVGVQIALIVSCAIFSRVKEDVEKNKSKI